MFCIGETMLEIIINGVPAQLGQPIPEEVTSLQITIQRDMFGQGPIIPFEQSHHVRAWIKELIKKTTTKYITFNGVLISTEEMKG